MSKSRPGHSCLVCPVVESGAKFEDRLCSEGVQPNDARSSATTKRCPAVMRRQSGPPRIIFGMMHSFRSAFPRMRPHRNRDPWESLCMDSCSMSPRSHFPLPVSSYKFSVLFLELARGSIFARWHPPPRTGIPLRPSLANGGPQHHRAAREADAEGLRLRQAGLTPLRPGGCHPRRPGHQGTGGEERPRGPGCGPPGPVKGMTRPWTSPGWSIIFKKNHRSVEFCLSRLNPPVRSIHHDETFTVLARLLAHNSRTKLEPYDQSLFLPPIPPDRPNGPAGCPRWAYCEAFGNNTRDPAAHTTEFLHEFVRLQTEQAAAAHAPGRATLPPSPHWRSRPLLGNRDGDRNGVEDGGGVGLTVSPHTLLPSVTFLFPPPKGQFFLPSPYTKGVII